MKFFRLIFVISMIAMLSLPLTWSFVLADDDGDDDYGDYYEDDDYEDDEYEYEEEEKEEEEHHSNKESKFENKSYDSTEVIEAWHTWSRSSSAHLSYEQLPFTNEVQTSVMFNEKKMHVNAFPYQGQIYVPLASISALMGAEYYEYEGIKACEMMLGNHHLIMKEGSKVVYENMKKTPMPQPILTSKGELFAPISVVTNGLDHRVIWKEREGFFIQKGEDTNGKK